MNLRALGRSLAASAPRVDGPIAGLTIGCLMVVQPVIFPWTLWVPQPADWPLNAVQGKTFDHRPCS